MSITCNALSFGFPVICRAYLRVVLAKKCRDCVQDLIDPISEDNANILAYRSRQFPVIIVQNLTRSFVKHRLFEVFECCMFEREQRVVDVVRIHLVANELLRQLRCVRVD